MTSVVRFIYDDTVVHDHKCEEAEAVEILKAIQTDREAGLNTYSLEDDDGDPVVIFNLDSLKIVLRTEVDT